MKLPTDVSLYKTYKEAPLWIKIACWSWITLMVINIIGIIKFIL